MTSAMLILLAACRLPVLRRLIRPDIKRAGTHLLGLIEAWMRVADKPISPSVKQSTRMLCEIDGFIQGEYKDEEENRLL